MSRASAVAATLVVLVLGALAYLADQWGLVDKFESGARDYGSSLLPVEQAPQSGGFSEAGVAESGDNYVLVEADGKEVAFPTLFKMPRWNHMPIKYYMNTGSGDGLPGFDEEDLDYVRSAVSVWEEKTGSIVSFEEVGSLEDAEVVFYWFPSLTEISNGRVVGEGGPTRAVNTGGKFTLIEGGEVFLIPTESACVGVNRPVHEIGHVLGLGHAPPGFRDIMFSTEVSCLQNITDLTSSVIGELYSAPAAPDLKISEVAAVKKGGRMDINVTTKNVGIKTSVRAEMGFFADGELIEAMTAPRFSTIPSIPPGSGVTNRMTGVPVPSGMKELLIVADYKSGVDELDEDNNRATVVFSEAPSPAE